MSTKKLVFLLSIVLSSIFISCVDNKVNMSEIAEGDRGSSSPVEVRETVVGTSKNTSFEIIEDSPIYPGCERVAMEERKDCLTRNIMQHIMKNFNTNIGSDLNLKGMQSIIVGFTIDADGDVVDIEPKTEHQALAEEAKRVFKLLPKMTPGKKEDENVSVKYSIPIRYEVN